VPAERLSVIGTTHTVSRVDRSAAQREQRWLGVLGRRDSPTDAVADYSRRLAAGLAGFGVDVRTLQLNRGGVGVVPRVCREVATIPTDWVLVHYTPLMWSRYGVPLTFPCLIGALRRRVRVAAVFHETRPFGGRRVQDVGRRRCQLLAMSAAARWAHKVITTVEPGAGDWIGGAAFRSKTAMIVVGSNVEGEMPTPRGRATGSSIVAVFGIRQDGGIEARKVAEIARRTAVRVGRIHLLLFGRGVAEVEPMLRVTLQGTGVSLETHGVENEDEVRARLASADVQLFVRGGISSRRGSAIAGIVAGLPVVGFGGPETAFPVTAAGVWLAKSDREGDLAEGVARVLRDHELNEALRARSREATAAYFSWRAIAERFVVTLASGSA
jgi:glycosyltransferase involved in cell wall biosynthesis